MKSIILKFANMLGERGLFRTLFPQHLPVFMLHRISNGSDDIPGAMNVNVLRSYLDYLDKRGYRVLSMDELCKVLVHREPLPKKSVMFTIDDGFYDHHDVAAKVFDEFGFKLNFFVITGMLDQKLWPWDDQVGYAFDRTRIPSVDLVLPSGRVCPVDLVKTPQRDMLRKVRNELKKERQEEIYSWIKDELFKKLEVVFPDQVPPEFRAMSWDDARSLRERGHGVFPHTCSHRILSNLSTNEKDFEIRESLNRVKFELNFDPDSFAYPTGRLADYDDLAISTLKKVGVTMAFNTVTDYITTGGKQDLYALPRFSLPDSMADFLQIITRLEALKDKLVNR